MTQDELGRAPIGSGERHPVLAGLVAFVAVVAVVAAVVGAGALVASKALGLSEAGSVETGSTVQETLFLPRPSDTQAPTGPLITLPGQPSPAGGDTSKPKPKPTKTPKPPPPIILVAAQSAVGPMEPIDLTGDHPGGDGAILRVQQFENGAWSDFPVTASVSGGRFATFIQTGAVGLNRFRMLDTDTGETSNEVKVQIG